MPYRILPTDTLKWLVHWELDLEGDSVEWEKVAVTQRTEHVPETAIAEMPRRFICKPRTPNVPDMAYRSGVWFVSPAVRGVIEDLEPGGHDFYKVNILNRKTKTDETFFILRIGQAVDSVVVEETKFESGIGWAGYERNPLPSQFGPIALRKASIAGKHLWRGGWVGAGSVTDSFWSCEFCSEELRTQIERHGFKKFEFLECMEI